MLYQAKPQASCCPVTADAVAFEAQKSFADLLSFCRTSESSFLVFEKRFFRSLGHVVPVTDSIILDSSA
jgi:hypothetical protein